LALTRLFDAGLAAIVVVPSQEDLVQRTPSSDLLHAWLGIIALGCRLVSQGQPQGPHCGIAYDASCFALPRVLCLTERFRTKHPSLARTFMWIAGLANSKWKVSGEVPGAARLDDLDNVKQFLLRSRRYAELNRVAGRYAAAAATEGDRATRYGNWPSGAPPLGAARGSLEAGPAAATGAG
jgi:hypothetical protein